MRDPDTQTDPTLVAFLESGQLVAETSRPLPLAQITRPARAALWALRVFVLLVTAMVVYAFVSQLS